MYTGLNFKGYKLYPSGNLVELNNLSNVNVIIGKNNSGKSSLLDVIEMVHDPRILSINQQKVESYTVAVRFTEEMVQSIFGNRPSTSDGWDQESYLDSVKDKGVWVRPIKTQSLDKIENVKILKDENKGIPACNDNNFRHIKATITQLINCGTFRRLSAEKNILPEEESGCLGLSSTGEGASNLIRAFMNDSAYDESLIEVTLLDALNEIMFPEAHFENIKIQQIDMDGLQKWEVYLTEDNMNRISLSNSGSGIKTILLVLLNLLVIPCLEEYKDKEIAFGFEELENNLHPAMQRKLFEYIYDYATQKNIQVYLTTHSHVAINIFCDKEKARVYHVVKKNNKATIQEVLSFIDKSEILDDLDVKASDILQSNGIIWVEGPSDRIYIKRWLEVFCDDKYEEGKNYQFLYYGGRLLAHYSADEDKELINILTTNRNAAIVMDSDRDEGNEEIGDTKKRIIREFGRLDMFCWTTAGKEIENYISKKAIEAKTGKKIEEPVEKYKSFSDYIKPYYASFKSNKVKFANEIKDCITQENSRSLYNLEEMITRLFECIEEWNA